jgi:hypothetical protein
MNFHWLLRMARWARHPPSARHVMLVAVVVVLGLALAGLERAGLWPESWQVNPKGEHLLRRP